MVKKWSRKVVDEDDEDLYDDEFEDDYDEDEDDEDERHIAPRRPARRHNPTFLASLGSDDDVDEDELDDLLTKVRAGKYVPKKSDHYTLHVAYNNLKNRNRPEV